MNRSTKINTIITFSF